MKTAVLCGGVSNEREVSIESGRNVARALESLGRYDVSEVVLDGETLAPLPRGTERVYIALHGGWGENGGVQAALDALGIPYTGPGAKASRIAMDKIKTKEVLSAVGVATSAWRVVDDPDGEPFTLPAVVKTPRDGSSVGVYLAKTRDEYRKAVENCLAIDPAGVLVEEYLPGRETTVGIIDGETLPPIEIVARGGWYGYDEKYKSDETSYPFVEEGGLKDALEKAALAAYGAVGCRGVARVDFRLDRNGLPNVLELNTSPGFTSHSLVPKAGMATGLSFAEVCEKILLAARCGEGGGE